MKFIGFLITLLVSCSLASACPVCRPKVEAGIYDTAYSANVLLILLPVALVLALGLGLFYWDKLTFHSTRAHATPLR